MRIPMAGPERRSSTWRAPVVSPATAPSESTRLRFAIPHRARSRRIANRRGCPAAERAARRTAAEPGATGVATGTIIRRRRLARRSRYAMRARLLLHQLGDDGHEPIPDDGAVLEPQRQCRHRYDHTLAPQA